MIVTTGNHYLAYVLKPELRDNLLVWYGARMRRHNVIVCHHITIAYDFTEEQVPLLQEFVDSNPTFTTLEYLMGDGIDCFTVKADAKTDRPLGGKFHLTTARSSSRNNRDANDLLSGELPVFDSIEIIEFLEGSFQLIAKGK